MSGVWEQNEQSDVSPVVASPAASQAKRFWLWLDSPAGDGDSYLLKSVTKSTLVMFVVVPLV